MAIAWNTKRSSVVSLTPFFILSFTRSSLLFSSFSTSSLCFALDSALSESSFSLRLFTWGSFSLSFEFVSMNWSLSFWKASLWSFSWAMRSSTCLLRASISSCFTWLWPAKFLMFMLQASTSSLSCLISFESSLACLKIASISMRLSSSFLSSFMAFIIFCSLSKDMASVSILDSILLMSSRSFSGPYLMFLFFSETCFSSSAFLKRAIFSRSFVRSSSRFCLFSLTCWVKLSLSLLRPLIFPISSEICFPVSSRFWYSDSFCALRTLSSFFMSEISF